MMKVTLILLTTVWLGLWSYTETASLRGNHGINYQLLYSAEVKSNIFDQEQINSTIKFTVKPVIGNDNSQLWYQMNLLHVTHSIASHHGAVTYPDELLENVVYFSTSPTGVVNNIYYDRDDLEEVVHLKKSMVSALSGHLVENLESEWEYSLEEVDHGGKAVHQYQAKKMDKGKVYLRQKNINPAMPHMHKKEYSVNHDGILTGVFSHENVILFKDQLKPLNSAPHSQDETAEEIKKIESVVHLVLLKQSTVTTLKHLTHSELHQLVNDSLQFHQNLDDKTYTLPEAVKAVVDGIKCTRLHGKISSKRSDCVMAMRKVIETLPGNDLFQLGDLYLKDKCNSTYVKTEYCQHDRDLLIDLISRVGSRTAQTIILKYVLKANDEAEIQRTLFHFTQLEQPTKDTVETVADMCFGTGKKYHGIMRIHGNQRRACMTLGAMLKHYVKVDEEATHELLDNFHTWLQTDAHKEHEYASNILRDPRHRVENERRLQFVHTKSVLLHALGNAAQPRSRDHIAVYAEPNKGHADVRHTAMQALRHYICDKSATLLLNASINDEDETIKRVAHNHYMLHPKAGQLSFTDENILISKDHNAEKYLRSKRSEKCDLVEKYTLDKRVDFTTFDWSKDVGNDFIGGEFGVKMVNFAHLHVSPIAMFFNLNLDNRAWITSWVTLLRKQNFPILNAEACFKREYRIFNLSSMVNFNVKDIITEFEEFDEVYNEVIQPIVASVNEFYYLLENWKENLTNVELGLGIRDAKLRLLDVRDNITDRVEDIKEAGLDWVNETFGGVIELVKDVKEFKASVINKKNEINDTIQQKKEEYFGWIQDLYDDSVDTIQGYINSLMQSMGISIDLNLIDQCMGAVDVIDIIKDADKVGQEVVECLKDKLKDAVADVDTGLMGQMNKLIRTARQLQQRFENITAKIDKVKQVVEGIQSGGWKFVVKKLLQRQEGLIDEMSTAMLDFINGILDDMGMNLQYIIKSIDDASQFIEKAVRLVKDSPKGALADITRGVIKMKISQGLFNKLKERFTEMGSELQGKVASWVEAGVEHANLIRELKKVIDVLKVTKKAKESVDNIRSAGSPREKLQMVLQEVSAIDAVSPLLEDIVEDLENIRYVADSYMDAFGRVRNGMKEAAKSFESLKRGAEGAKALVQKIFGIKFHPAFPKQVKTQCDDNCGGCGIYPNILRGRRGMQLLAEEGMDIVAPFDSRVVPIEGNNDEVMLYPLGADMSDYEVIITYIKPDQQIYDDPEGFFADAGVVIGQTLTSPCQPNFIHVAVRKLNSTVESPSKSIIGLDMKSPVLHANDEGCGIKDQGEYVPADKYVNSPDPNPLFMEGCSKAEFKHIYDYYDLQALADKLDEFMLDFEQKAEEIGDKIEKGLEQPPEYPDDTNWDEVKAMEDNVAEPCSQFTYGIQSEGTKPVQTVQYAYDEEGNWRKKISFNLPPELPKMTDFFNTMNSTVEEFGEFLQESGLEEQYRNLMTFTKELAEKMNEGVCVMLDKLKAAKLRLEATADGGSLDLSKEDMKRELEWMKMQGCKMIEKALAKGERHYCKVDPAVGCNLVECITRLVIGGNVTELPVGIAFDKCSLKVTFFIGPVDVEVVYNGSNAITKLSVAIDKVKYVDLTAEITVTWNIPENKVKVDLFFEACAEAFPACYDYTHVFDDLEFELGSERNRNMCLNLTDYFTCKNDTTPGSYLQSNDDLIKDILKWKVRQYLYSMERFGFFAKVMRVKGMLDSARTAISEGLLVKTLLKSAIKGKEIFNLPDLKVEDYIDFGRFDIPFYNIPFAIPPIIITVSAGGVVQIGLDFGVNILSANCSIVPWFSVGSSAVADGRASLGIGSVGLKMTGTLLETKLSLLVETRWDDFPIEIDFTFTTDLIPLGVDFKGYVKVLKVPVEFRIFQWVADLIEGIPQKTKEEINDLTAPIYEWADSVKPYSSSQGEMTCRIEQVLARHWSDPAFFIEAPFYDPESLLHLEYCIGTYKDGLDVLEWQVMEGSSMVVPIMLKMTGIPLHFSVKATNTDGLSSIARCILDTYDVTPATGRFEPAHVYTSRPDKLAGSLMVIEDSPLIEEQYTGIGVARGYLGDQVKEWYLFDLDKEPVNPEGEGDLAYFSAARPGKLTSSPITSTKTIYDHECAALCREVGDGCASFDYDYNTDTCDLHWTIQGKAADLVLKGAYHNFEKLGAGYTAYFDYDGMDLIHGEAYYLNARITNVRGFESYLTSPEIIVDFTTPGTGPIGDFIKDEMRHDDCSATITHGERCIHVTPFDNHRHIIDGPGASTVFNGNYPEYDMLYTISNHYMTANWAGFHDNETDIWGYTWAAGRSFCGTDVQEWDDPHSHLADKSYWTHQGLTSDILLEDGPYFVTVQALNNVVFGGALVTSVCHSTPIIVDTTAPWLDFVEDVFYDEDFDLLGVYYKASDPESGIMRTDIGLGETKHDVFIRAYSRHDPLHDGYEMVSVDGVDLPIGVAVWVRVRVVNNVEMLTADHAKQPLMMDPTPPVTGSILDGDTHLKDMEYQPYDDRMCVQWYDWYDPESGIDRFLWAIGSSPNDTDIMEFREYDHYTKSACVDLQLNHSDTYYNIIMAYNKAINSRASQKSSDGITVDITAPLAGWVTDGPDSSDDIEYSSEAASVYSNWGDFSDPESDIQEYTVTVSVNGVDREVFNMAGNEEYLEDHTLHFQHADYVQVTVEAENGALLQNDSHSTGYVVDLTPPDVVFVKDHPQGLKYQVSDSQMYAHWLFEDEESHIKEYRLRILEHKNKNSLHMWPEDAKYESYLPKDETDTEFEVTIDDMILENGMRYSVEVTAINGAEFGSLQESLGVIVDTTPPIMSKVYIGSFGADEDLNENSEVIHDDHYGIQTSWVGYDHESGIIKFMVAVGTEEGDTSVTGGYRDFGTEPDGYIDGISLNVTEETGTLYYVSIYAINGAGVHSEVLASRPIHVYGENVAGVVYDGRDVYVDKDYGTDTVTFAVSFQGFDSPACGIRAYEWALGSEPGYSDILPYSSYGIVMLNESHAITEIHLPLKHGDIVFASVRAHTGHRCSEAILHSCSDGIIIDTESPEVQFVTLGVFGNDTEEEISQSPSLYQMEKNSISLEWNTTDDISGPQNDTWMAGSLPLLDNKHPSTVSTDRQIPIRAVTMAVGETTIFSVVATDMAGNIKNAIAPSLTVDLSTPVVEGFRCTEYLSPVQTEISCEWNVTVDSESPVIEQRLGIGDRQMGDQIISYKKIPFNQYNWKHALDKLYDKIANKTKVIVTLQVVNKVGLVASVFSRLTIDKTPPVLADTYITTPVRPGEVNVVKVCQPSISTIEVSWNPFTDEESGIHSYEVGIGTAPGKADISAFRNVGQTTNVFLDQLVLTPGTQVFASVRAVNHASLISGSTSAGVYISPSPHIEVWDGLGDTDVDFQNDISSISGQVFMTHYCPIQVSRWIAYDIMDHKVVNETEFFRGKFANDELHLQNFRTYYVMVEIVDAINRSLKGKSDGVMLVIQPPRPGEVRDGPHYGEDRNYQESTTVLSINWDQFGDPDDPLQNIVKYEVAIGDNIAYPETRTNVHYYQDVGLNLNHTFYDLRLTPKRVKYFATVKGYSESGATIESVSNGIWVGYSAGMEAGEVKIARYSNNGTYLSFYWDKFKSDFNIIHYRWGIGMSAFADDNVTLQCSELLGVIHNWANVQPLVDQNKDTFAERFDLSLQHSTDYYVITVAEDEAGQCITAPTEMFTVDLTPPDKGQIKVEGLSPHVQYSTNKYLLQASWINYKDDESGITDFFIELKRELDCTGSPPETWETVVEQLDVKDTDRHTYMGLELELDIPYRIVMTVTNGAGLTIQDWSDPIYLDITPAVEGVVKDGLDWTTTRYYQSSTSELQAVFAISPLGSEHDCPLVESLLPPDNVTWNLLNDYVIEDEEGNHYKGIYIDYQDRNIQIHGDKTTEIVFHYNISTLALESGALVSEPRDLLEGEYTMTLKGPTGQKTVFSYTMSNGWMDEYTDFELPVIEDQMSDEDFIKDAKSGDLDFDRDLDATLGTTQLPLPPTTAETTTEPQRNLTEPDFSYRDGFDTNAVGFHIFGFPFGNNTQVWVILFWARHVEGIKTDWIYLDQDPANCFATYSLDVEKDVAEADALWNVYFSINGTRLSKMSGLNVPQNHTITMRHWTHDRFVPKLTDPFNPFYTSTIITEFTVPLPKDRPCQFGKAFYDMESGVQQVYVGISNSTNKDDNIVSFQLAHELCHSCELMCDYYKCSDSCDPSLDDGYQLLTVQLTNLTLEPGGYKTEGEMLDRFNMDKLSDDENSNNDTAYLSNRYYVLIKTVNEAGLERITSSPGVKIDITPPIFDSMEATDPEYDPLVPTAYQWSTDGLAAWWVFEDKESPVWEYLVAVGTTKNATNVVPYTSVGTATSVELKLDSNLIEGQTYYLTVQAINAAGLSSFASTNGVTILSTAPDVSNATSVPLYSEIFPPGSDPEINQDFIYISEFQNKMGLSYHGTLDDSVFKFEWGAGESYNDTYITSEVEVDRREYNWTTLEVREDGYFYFGGQKSETHLTWLAQRSAQINMTLEDEYVDPGRLWLEPGRCVHHRLYAMNMAHIRALVSHTPVCIKRSVDHIVHTRGTFSVDYEKDQTKVQISGKGVSGFLISTAVDQALYEEEYVTSANISYTSFIVNPNYTLHQTSRIMRNRLDVFTERTILISPAADSNLLEPLEITFSYSGLSWDHNNQTLAILYWDIVQQQWYNVEESSNILSELNPTTEHITGWFAGRVKTEEDGDRRKRSMENIILTDPHMFVLFVVKSENQNSCPVLINRILMTNANEVLETQLLYYDRDDDIVSFELNSEAEHGLVNVTEDGILSYLPDDYYYGWDEVNITMTEVSVPPGTEPFTVIETIRINVREIPFAPWLFLELSMGLNKTANRWRAFRNAVEIQYEANTTTKSLGTLYVCDLNPTDTLNLTWINIDRDNVTVDVKLLDTDADANLLVQNNLYCAEKNLKIFEAILETSMEYYGYDQIQFIGYDNFTLFSQVIQVNMYTLFSPCGTYGTCTSEHDPNCESNARSESFENYECACDTWHKAAYCDVLNVLKITFTSIGACWLIILVAFGLVKTRKNYQALRKIEPLDDITEMDNIDVESSDENTGISEEESDSVEELEVEPVQKMHFDPDADAPKRYQNEFRVEAWKNWIAPEEIGAAAVSSTEAVKKKKTKKTKKRKIKKKNKVSAL